MPLLQSYVTHHHCWMWPPRQRHCQSKLSNGSIMWPNLNKVRIRLDKMKTLWNWNWKSDLGKNQIGIKLASRLNTANDTTPGHTVGRYDTAVWPKITNTVCSCFVLFVCLFVFFTMNPVWCIAIFGAKEFQCSRGERLNAATPVRTFLFSFCTLILWRGGKKVPAQLPAD